MQKLIIYILISALLTANIAVAEPPVIWNGSYAKSIASSGFQHKSNRVIRDCGSTDPTAGAGLTASRGSICQYDSGAAGKLFVKSGAGNTAWTDLTASATTGWGLTGNAITDGDFIGPTNASDFVLKVNGTEVMRYASDGTWDSPFGEGPLQASSDGEITARPVNLATSAVTGTLGIGNGGTNSASALNNNRVMRSSGGAIVEASAITANRALISDANGIPTHSATTNTELGYVAGVTSGIQSQLDGKQASGNYITGLASDVVATGPGSVNATIQPDVVGNTKLANMAQDTVKCRASGAGTGDPTDCSDAQVAAILDGYFADSIGTVDSETKSSNGAVINAGGALVLQSASPGFPGLASDGAQTFTGQKTFTSNVRLEDPGSGTNKITLAVPTLSSDFNFPLPASDGTTGQVYTKTATGASWQTPSGSGGAGPRESLSRYNANGLGSTNTAVLKWSTSNATHTQGTELTYVETAANGGHVLVGADGVYAINITYGDGATVTTYGIVIDPTGSTYANGGATLTGNIRLLGPADGAVAAGISTVASSWDDVGWTGYLATGAKIYFLSNAGAAGGANSRFTVTKVAD
jgi:hypothetical protein